ncbi:hypothetical protein A2Z10_02065 [Candidatus Azambacteria bacterium RBG_16_47_10]|uniref:SET domain-containing protein n=1 Tax=Candidatus Azambacteria bacterium RBG_16_47_10 TaxID=1797292 RepID=A0A1F5B066_9BACT|nr:MAG: hypothetical protein A2Z10_02065 [Candidatus Azambacteria bacterium RBG_16_47_10]
MESKTTEFSFILKASDHGVGVFVVHGIKAETFLRVFGDENNPSDVSIVRKKEDVPEFFRQYCVDRGDVMGCPKDFGCMEVGWFINHSKIPSAHVRDREYYALRDILAGEEITIDYNSLNEPEETKKDYYKK